MKKLLLTLFLTMSVLLAWAKPVSINTARQIAENFAITQNISVDDNPVVNIAPEGMFHQLYVFGFDGAKGFVVVAADDRVIPILGYSLTTYFTSSDMPEHVKDWFFDYEAQIDSLVAHNVEPTALVQREWNAYSNSKSSVLNSMAAVVGPLVTTTWDQSPYYNNLCPTKDGTRTITGCVATATAQIMKYWNHPSTGHGSHSYSWNGQTLSANFGNTTYQWSNMPTSLTASSSSTKKTAVATLMYHIGVAVEMEYNTSANGGSSASNFTDDFSPSAELALQRYFKYSNNIHHIRYSDCTDAQWKTILKSELDASRVVLYDGRDPSGGHSFVCDGYNNNNYFHFNWGWGGTYDGFYAIGDLHPGTGGSGGNSTYTFNLCNGAVIGIEPIQGTIPTKTTVTATSANTSLGTVSGSGSYNQYDVATLMATANEGYIFDHWDDNSKSNPRYVIATSSSFNKTAYFVPLPTDTLHYCGEEWQTAFYSTGTKRWGIRYPASALETNKELSVVQVMLYQTGQYNLILYQGDGSQMTQVYSQQFTNSVSCEWTDIHLNVPYQIDNTKSFWITLSYTGSGYPMTMSSFYGGNNDGMRYYYNNTWTSYPDVNNRYGSWLIKGVIKDVTTSFYTLNATALPSDGGSVTPTYSSVPVGTVVTLTASAADNYRFVNWSDGSTDYTRYITVNGNMSVTANFESIEQGNEVGYCVHDIVNNLGMSGGGTIMWGAKFESGSPLQDKALNAISYYNDQSATTDITAKIYRDGTDAPQTLLGQFSFTPTPNGGWQTYQLPTPINCGNNVMWVILSCDDASYFPCSYTSYSANSNGSFISLDGGDTYDNVLDYGFDATWMIRAVVGDVQQNPDTIDVVCTQASSQFYSEDNDLYIVLQNDDYGFIFDVVCEQGETDIVDGQTYTLADMLGYYSLGYDKSMQSYIGYTSASIVRNNDSYDAYVTDANGQSYHVTYTAPRPIDPIDTVYVVINDKQSCFVVDYTASSGMFQFRGEDTLHLYSLYFTIQNATSVAGTYTDADVLMNGYTALNIRTADGAVSVQLSRLLPNAVVTAGQAPNSYNALIHYLGTDSVLYEIYFEYADPVPSTIRNFTGDLQLAQSSNYDEYVQYGIYAYDFTATGDDYILYGTVYNENADEPYGTYNLVDGNISVGYFDATTQRSVYEPFSGSVTISTDGTNNYLTGSILCYGDIQFINNCTDYVARDTILVDESHSICQGDVYQWHGRNFTESGIYYDTIPATTDYDSVYTLTLTVNPTYYVTESDTVYDVELPYLWHGQPLTESGIYVDTLQSVFGCDSVCELTLTVEEYIVAAPINLVAERTGVSEVIFKWSNGSQELDNNFSCLFLRTTATDINPELYTPTLSGVTDTFYVRTLNAGVEYHFYVKNVYRNVSSEWTEVSVNLSKKPAVTDLSASDITNVSFKATWSRSAYGQEGQWKVVATDKSTGNEAFTQVVNRNACIVTGLAGNTEYTLTVTPMFTSTEGESASIDVTTLRDCVAPENLHYERTGAGEATISWSNGSEDQDNNFTYLILRTTATGVNPESYSPTASGVTDTFYVRSLNAGVEYHFYVKNVCEGISSPWSEVVINLPSKPAVTDLSASDITNVSFKATWSRSAYGQEGQWKVVATDKSTGNEAFTQVVNRNACIVTGLAGNTEYTLTVTPMFTSTEGESASIDVTTLRDCVAPENLHYYVTGDNEITITWSNGSEDQDNNFTYLFLRTTATNINPDEYRATATGVMETSYVRSFNRDVEYHFFVKNVSEGISSEWRELVINVPKNVTPSYIVSEETINETVIPAEAYVNMDKLYVENLVEGVNVTIVDASGKMLFCGNVDNIHMEFDLTVRGVYMVVIRGDQEQVLKVVY